MENKILIEDGFESRIRSKMGVSSHYLSDEDIQKPEIIGVAEANIITMVPDYADLDGNARVYLEAAVVLECCVLIAPSMSIRLPKKESGPHAGHELWINWENKKLEFIDERDGYIGKIYDILGSHTHSLPHFTVTYPRKGW